MRTTWFLVLVSLVVLSGGCSKKEEALDAVKYPVRLQFHVKLIAAEKGGEVRRQFYDQRDPERLIKEEVERQGYLDVLYYGPNGKLKELCGYYPQEGSKALQLRRSVFYEADGKTVLLERDLRKDGTLEQTLRTRPDGAEETEKFFADGKQVQVRRIESQAKGLVLEEKFSADGTLEKVSKRIATGYQVTVYRPSGSRLSCTTRGEEVDDPVFYVQYREDGDSVEMRVKYSVSQIDVSYYRKEGTLAEERSFPSDEHCTFVIYGEDGKARYRQRWRRANSYSGYSDPNQWTETNGFVLEKIEELNGDGAVLREIEFYEDGKTPFQIRFPVQGKLWWAGKTRHFRRDGTLEKEEIRDDDGAVKETKDFKPEDKVKENIPDEFFKLGDRAKPPVIDKMPEARPYRYDNHWPW